LIAPVTEQDSRRAIEAVFRIASARLIAGLMRLVRDVDLATKAELRAAVYVVANWDRLSRSLGDARISLDNIATERAFRGPVVGRKNHCGSKSMRGTEVAAIFYTLLESAKLQSVDPATYLRAAALARARGEIRLPGQLVSWHRAA
jgi:hypothetical protein